MLVAEEKRGTVRKIFWAEKPVLPRIITDHLGSIRVTLDQSGNVDSWTDYYPFGKESRGLSTSNRPKEQFTGKERDAEIGLDYFGARYYNPDIVRWTSVDPLWEKHPDWTPYNYVLGNPLILVDPDGRQVDINTNRFMPNGSVIKSFDEAKAHFANTVNLVFGLEGGVKTLDLTIRIKDAEVGLELSPISGEATVNQEGTISLEGKVVNAGAHLTTGDVKNKVGFTGMTVSGEIKSNGDVTGPEFNYADVDHGATVQKLDVSVPSDQSFKVGASGKFASSVKVGAHLDIYQGALGLKKAAEGVFNYVKQITDIKKSPPTEEQ